MSVPIGGIIFWSDALGAIPTGFVLCDGSGDTRNLIDRCVVGAGDDYAVGASGVGGLGTARTHSHDVDTVLLTTAGGAGSGTSGQHDWTSTISDVAAVSTAQLTVATGNFPEYSGLSHHHDWSSTVGFSGNIPPVAGGDHPHPMSGTYAANERRIPLPQVCALYPIVRVFVN